MRRLSLQTKVLLSVGLIILVVLGTSTTVHIQDLKRDYLEALAWRSEALAQGILSDVIKKYQYNSDIQSLLKGSTLLCIELYELTKEKNVTHFAIIDASGVFAAHNDKQFWDTPVESPVLLEHLQRREQTTVLDGTIYHTLIPMFGEQDAYIGTIDIGFPKVIVDEKVRQLLLKAVGLFVLFVMVTFIGTSVLVHLVMVKPIRRLIIMGKKIARGELVGTLQSDVGTVISTHSQKKSSNEIEALTAVFHDMIGYLQEMAHAATRIAIGDLRQEITPQSEHDVLGTAFQQMSAYLNEMATAATTIALGNVRLQIQPKTDHDVLGNAFTEFISYIQEMAAIATTIAEGDLSQEITPRSQQDELGYAFQRMAAYLKDIMEEIEGVIQAVQEGKLSRRGNVEPFSGDWQNLMRGLNNVIDAFVDPITVTAEHLERISTGNIPDKITKAYQGDFNVIKQNVNLLIETTHAITRLAEELAAGNLTVEIRERSDQDTLMQALNAMITKLSAVVIQVKSSADSVAIGSRQMRIGSENLSQGTALQAASAEEVSASMQQIAANIRQNADNARQTEKIALQAAEYAEESGRVVAETVVAMQQIAKKIAIIQEIADQTRMLSLNATIEAARAQEHGKAFSVVASEVRKLSNITKTAAEEINELTTSSLAVSEKAGEVLTTLIPSIHKTTELVQEISAASGEQSSGAEQVNTAIQQLDQVTQQNSAMSDEMASTSEELAIQAEQLQRTMAFFKIGETTPQPPDAVSRSMKPVPKGTPPENVANNMYDDAKKDDGYEMSLEWIEMNQEVEGEEDERDAEFERY